MSEVLDIHKKHDYILVGFIGEFNLEAGKRTVDSMIEACFEHDLFAVLLDCRSMTGNLSIMDRYRLVVYGQRMLGKVNRVALVGRQEAVLPDRFAETVAVNRGINLKVFIDMDQAVDWLKAQAFDLQ